jgi:hypothetical protein
MIRTPLTLAATTPTPTPTGTTRPGAGTTHGAVFFVLAVVILGALLISVWRLRRRVSGPET